MSLLLKEIKDIDKRAADVLKRADLQTDSDIQALTREELLVLFPAVQDLKLRRTIFDVIHKPRPVESLLKKLKGFIPSESFRAALTDDGVLVDYLQILKDMKTQTNNVQSFLEAHIGLLEEYSKNQPDQESANCAPEEAQGSGTSDARGEEWQHIGTTGDHPPEAQKSSSGPSTSVTGGAVELNSGQSDGRPGGAQDYFRGSSTSDGHPQGTQKSSSGPSTSVTGGPVKLHRGQSDGRPGGAPDYFRGSGTSDNHPQGTRKSLSGPSYSVTGGPVGLYSDDRPRQAQESHRRGSGTSDGHPQGTQSQSTSVTGGAVERHSGQSYGRPATLYKMVVSGKTFDTHLKLMEKVEKSVQNQIRHCEFDQDNQITFVFCPISSRVASDVEAALSDIKDDKPLILVLMHHTRDVKATSSMRTWNDDARVVLHVNVFYHETIGLLRCDRNDAAVTEIQTKLQESFIQRSKDTSGNDQVVGADVTSNKSILSRLTRNRKYL